MLGHKLWQIFHETVDTYVSVRQDYARYAKYGIFDPTKMCAGLDAQDFATFVATFEKLKPDAVINCIGIVKQLPLANNPIVSIEINALFPHRIAKLCHAIGARLIHISTDCVFSGQRGMYTEEDTPDPLDLYDRSKLLGEVNDPCCLTLRTSFIGRELGRATSLVEWFLSNQGNCVQGYTNAIYTGFSTTILGRIIADVIQHHANLSGVYHVSSEPISKYKLLCLLRDAYQTSIEINPFPGVRVDRSMDSSRFRQATGLVPPPWPEMVQAMASDPTPYEQWRRARAS
jgi:dTDP-4-dehydrorhamnose reductase